MAGLEMRPGEQRVCGGGGLQNIEFGLTFFLLLMWPLVDTLNGFLKINEISELGISLFYKGGLCVYFLFLVMIRSRLYFLVLIGVLIACFFVLISHYFRYFVGVEDVSWVVRGWLSLAILFYLLSCPSDGGGGYWAEWRIFLLCSFYFSVAAANVLLGYFGFGQSQYVGGVGGKGYILAGNELSFFMLASSSVILMYLGSRVGALSYFLVFVALLFFSVLKATKVSILGVVLLFLLCLFYEFERNRRERVRILLSAVVLSPFLFIALFMAIQEVGLYERFEYFYYEQDFMTFLLSSRNVFLESALVSVVYEFSFLDFLFGIGVDNFKGIMGSQVEIDPVDIFISYGVVGGVGFYSAWALVFLGVLRSRCLSFCSRISLILILVLFVCLGFFSGHVFNSGVSSSVLALFFYFSIRRRTA